MPKPLLPADLTSRQWEALDQSLTARGFLSARVEDARTLSMLQRLCAGIAEGSLGEGEARDRARLWLETAGYAPEDPEDEGTIKDLRAKSRLDVLFDINVGHAKALAYYNAGQDEAILDMYPCQELFRAIDSRNKRDWRARWAAAGGRFYGGRMIARKDDPIWVRISRFGTPVPPFDYNSGMDVRDVHRADAEALGVIARSEPAPEPEPIDPMAGYQVDASGFSPGLAQEIADLSGGLVELFGSVLRWRGAPTRAAFAKRKAAFFKQCPKDGGFLSKDGSCNHPNHAERAKIIAGFKGKCTRKLARELLREGIDVQGADGRKVRFDRFVRDHYELGLRRKDNTPKPENLELLPVAIYAVRNGSRELKFARGTTPDYLNPPRGTQAVYSIPYDSYMMRVYVYADTGRVSGWHIAKK